MLWLFFSMKGYSEKNFSETFTQSTQLVILFLYPKKEGLETFTQTTQLLTLS